MPRLWLIKEAVLDGRADFDAKWSSRTAEAQEFCGVCAGAGFTSVLVKYCLGNAYCLSNGVAREFRFAPGCRRSLFAGRFLRWAYRHRQASHSV